jgi:hypothetical protein
VTAELAAVQAEMLSTDLTMFKPGLMPEKFLKRGSSHAGVSRKTKQEPGKWKDKVK